MVGVSYRSRFSRAQSKQNSAFGFSWQAPPRSRNSIAASSASLTRAPFALRSLALTVPGDLARSLRAHWPLRRTELVLFGGGRAEEVGDDLDREDARDPAVGIDHRRVLG